MALQRTFLTVAMQPNDIQFVPANAALFPAAGTILNASPQQPVWIQDELVFVFAVNIAGIPQVRGRGSDGQRGVLHDVGSPIVTSPLPSDFPALATANLVLQDIFVTDVQVLGSSQTIPAPVEDIRYGIASLTPITVTIPAPNLVPNGIRLSFTVLPGFGAAHVLTSPLLINNGATGGPFTNITFPTFAGVDVVLEGWNGQWNVVSVNGAVTYS